MIVKWSMVIIIQQVFDITKIIDSIMPNLVIATTYDN